MTRIPENSRSSAIYCTTLFAFVALLPVLQAVTALAAPQDQSGRSSFNSTCASCRGQNGAPSAVGKSLNAPDLGSKAVQNRTDAELQQIVANGKGNMPPFNGRLSEAQINSLVAYIHTFSAKRK
jgi:mono/diheme cytochrome c family protein